MYNETSIFGVLSGIEIYIMISKDIIDLSSKIPRQPQDDNNIS